MGIIVEIPKDITDEQVNRLKHSICENDYTIANFPIKLHNLGNGETKIIRKGEHINWRQIIENGH